jgi:dsRNA-specific ribonuclease
MAKSTSKSSAWTKPPAQVFKEQKAAASAWTAEQTMAQTKGDTIRKAEQQAAEQAILRLQNANVSLPS